MQIEAGQAGLLSAWRLLLGMPLLIMLLLLLLGRFQPGWRQGTCENLELHNPQVCFFALACFCKAVGTTTPCLCLQRVLRYLLA
jgi:hypothetical protein